MRWYPVATLGGPSCIVADGLVFVADLGSDAANLAAARSAFATSRLLNGTPSVAVPPQLPC